MCVCGGETSVCVCVCVRGEDCISAYHSKITNKKMIGILYFVPIIIHREGVL